MLATDFYSRIHLKSLYCHSSFPKFVRIESPAWYKSTVGKSWKFAKVDGNLAFPEIKIFIFLQFLFLFKYFMYYFNFGNIFSIILPNNLPLQVAKHCILVFRWCIIPRPITSPLVKYPLSFRILV